MKIIRRILPYLFSIKALTSQNERRVEKFKHDLEQLDSLNYANVEKLFEKDMLEFAEEMGINIDWDSGGQDPIESPIKTSNQSVKSIRIPPKNSTEFITYATEELKKKLPLEQKEKVEEIQHKLSNHESVSKEDKLKLLMFEEIAIKFEDWGEPAITGRSMNMGIEIQDQGSALSQIGYYLDSIWNYGCWCYFGDNMSHGRGIPVNKVDQVCRALNYCYTCVRMDESENRKSCAPGTVSYNRPTTLDTQKKSWEIACETNNDNDDCKINTCKCETQFVKSLIELFFDGYRFQPDYKHDLGIFDPRTCGPKPPQIRGLDNQEYEGTGTWKKPQGERRCCGSYPDRKPYNSAFQGCCSRRDIGHVYNMEERMCCKDGSVKLVCPDYVDGLDD